MTLFNDAHSLFRPRRAVADARCIEGSPRLGVALHLCGFVDLKPLEFDWYVAQHWQCDLAVDNHACFVLQENTAIVGEYSV